MSAAADPLHVVCPHCQGVNRIQQTDLAKAPNCGRCKALLFEARPVALDEAAFDRHIGRNDIPVLVDFWAPWCGPCRQMAPAYEQAAGQLEPYLRVAKLDTEQAPRIAERFAIRSIPTLALFQQGREVARQAGALGTAGAIVQWARGAAEELGGQGGKQWRAYTQATSKTTGSFFATTGFVRHGNDAAAGLIRSSPHP